VDSASNHLEITMGLYFFLVLISFALFLIYTGLEERYISFARLIVGFILSIMPGINAFFLIFSVIGVIQAIAFKYKGWWDNLWFNQPMIDFRPRKSKDVNNVPNVIDISTGGGD
jgi:hypothetical protein